MLNFVLILHENLSRLRSSNKLRMKISLLIGIAIANTATSIKAMHFVNEEGKLTPWLGDPKEIPQTMRAVRGQQLQSIKVGTDAVKYDATLTLEDCLPFGLNDLSRMLKHMPSLPDLIPKSGVLMGQPMWRIPGVENSENEETILTSTTQRPTSACQFER